MKPSANEGHRDRVGVAAANDSRAGRLWGRWLPSALAVGASLGLATVAALVTRDPSGGLNPLVEGASASSSSTLGSLGQLLPFGFAFAAGMASAANPCGFSLLPAYVGLLLSRRTDRSDRLVPRLASAVLIATSVTAAFVSLFATVGLLIGLGGQAVVGAFPVAGIAVGVGLIVAGTYRLGGGSLYVSAPERLAARLGSRGGGIRGYLLFGLTYGTASLSCTLPIFLAVLGGSLARASLGDALAQLTLYGLGMGLVIGTLTVAVALFRETLQRWLTGAVRWVEPAGTFFLFAAGIYIVYYWLTIGGLLRS